MCGKRLGIEKIIDGNKSKFFEGRVFIIVLSIYAVPSIVLGS